MRVKVRGSESLAASERVRASRQRQARHRVTLPGLAVYTASWVGDHTAWVQQDPHDPIAAAQVYLTDTTWDIINHDETTLAWFVERVREGGEGMQTFTVKDAGPYAEAARKAAPEPVPVDRLDALLAEARSLIIQVASLNQAPTPGQLAVFAARRTELARRFEEVADTVAEVGSALDLAAAAIVDVAEDA